MSREIPKIFCAEQIKAIQAGRMTQFREVIRPQPTRFVSDKTESREPGDVVIYRGFPCILKESRGRNKRDSGELTPVEIKSRYQIGDELYVKEAWSVFDMNAVETAIAYFADPDDALVNWFSNKAHSIKGKYRLCQWRSARYMPKAYARLWLRVTAVKEPHQVQTISEENCIAEGIEIIHADEKKGHTFTGTGYWDTVSHHCIHRGKTYHVASTGGICQCNEGKKHTLTPAKCAFRILWNHLHPPLGRGKASKPGERFEDGPWVFPYVFERIEK